jgi:hypothetical protein
MNTSNKSMSNGSSDSEGRRKEKGGGRERGGSALSICIPNLNKITETELFSQHTTQ